MAKTRILSIGQLGAKIWALKFLRDCQDGQSTGSQKFENESLYHHQQIQFFFKEQ